MNPEQRKEVTHVHRQGHAPYGRKNSRPMRPCQGRPPKNRHPCKGCEKERCVGWKERQVRLAAGQSPRHACLQGKNEQQPADRRTAARNNGKTATLFQPTGVLNPCPSHGKEQPRHERVGPGQQRVHRPRQHAVDGNAIAPCEFARPSVGKKRCNDKQCHGSARRSCSSLNNRQPPRLHQHEKSKQRQHAWRERLKQVWCAKVDQQLKQQQNRCSNRPLSHRQRPKRCPPTEHGHEKGCRQPPQTRNNVRQGIRLGCRVWVPRRGNVNHHHQQDRHAAKSVDVHLAGQKPHRWART